MGRRGFAELLTRADISNALLLQCKILKTLYTSESISPLQMRELVDEVKLLCVEMSESIKDVNRRAKQG